MLKRLLIAAPLALGLILCACSSLQTNPTVFPYRIDHAWLKSHKLHKVVIAPFRMGGKARPWLREGEPIVEKQLAAYLKEHGFEVIPNNAFSVSWQNAIRQYGNPWDPTTGKVNRETLAQAMKAALENTQRSTPFDAAIVFDLIDRSAHFESGSEGRVRWDGVTRPPELVGPDQYVTENFNWDQPIEAFSIAINVYSSDFQNIFNSVGGIDLAQDINTRTGTEHLTRRERPFKYETHIEEGIALALHPLVPMKNYPAPKP